MPSRLQVHQQEKLKASSPTIFQFLTPITKHIIFICSYVFSCIILYTTVFHYVYVLLVEKLVYIRFLQTWKKQIAMKSLPMTLLLLILLQVQKMRHMLELSIVEPWLKSCCSFLPESGLVHHMMFRSSLLQKLFYKTSSYKVVYFNRYF